MKDALEGQIVELIRARDLQDGLASLAEAGIDQLLQDGFLRDVPILGSVVGVIRTAGTIRDLLLAKKLGRFLSVLQSVPQAERQAFHDSLADRAERNRVGEALLLLLDRLDDMDKPELIGRLFRAFIRSEIDRETFQLMATAVDRLFMPHLAELASFYSSGSAKVRKKPVDVYQALAFAGLVQVEARGDGGGLIGPEFAGATIHYGQNELGALFVNIITSNV
jgi:hypothetical protein